MGRSVWLCNSTALPFLSARRVEKGLQTMGHLTDLGDRPADRLRCPIQVQDQPVPEAIGRLQAIRPLGNHAGLVIDPLHRCTGLTRIEVVQDRRLPAVVGREESTEVQAQVLGLPAELPQPPRGCDPSGSRVEDLLEPQPDLIHLLQSRQLLEQRLQRLPLLSGQTLGVAAEFPHPAAEGVAFLLVQLRLVRAGEFFRRVSTASLNFLATWNRSVTARLFFSRTAHAAGEADPRSTRWVRTCWCCSSESRSRHFNAAAVSLPRATARIFGWVGSLRSVINVT